MAFLEALNRARAPPPGPAPHPADARSAWAESNPSGPRPTHKAGLAGARGAIQQVAAAPGDAVVGVPLLRLQEFPAVLQDGGGLEGAGRSNRPGSAVCGWSRTGTRAATPQPAGRAAGRAPLRGASPGPPQARRTTAAARGGCRPAASSRPAHTKQARARAQGCKTPGKQAVHASLPLAERAAEHTWGQSMLPSIHRLLVRPSWRGAAPGPHSTRRCAAAGSRGRRWRPPPGAPRGGPSTCPRW
jgi:hypothetical protein